MRRAHRTLATLALGLALATATTAAAAAMPPTGTEDAPGQAARRELYQSELEVTLARDRALSAIAAQPAATADPTRPSSRVYVLATLLIGLVGGLLGGAGVMVGGGHGGDG
jgi:heme A synthase